MIGDIMEFETINNGMSYGYGLIPSIAITDEVINSESELKDRLSVIDDAIKKYMDTIIDKIENKIILTQIEMIFLMQQKYSLSNTLGEIDYAKKNRNKNNEVK